MIRLGGSFIRSILIQFRGTTRAVRSVELERRDTETPTLTSDLTLRYFYRFSTRSCAINPHQIDCLERRRIGGSATIIKRRGVDAAQTVRHITHMTQRHELPGSSRTLLMGTNSGNGIIRVEVHHSSYDGVQVVGNNLAILPIPSRPMTR